MKLISPLFLFLRNDHGSIQKHVYRCARIVVDAWSKIAEYPVQLVAHFAHLFPEHKRIMVIRIFNAFALNLEGLAGAVGMEALLKKMIHGKVSIVRRIDLCDQLQFSKQFQNLGILNIL